jgi:hypothetical protein
LILLDYFSSQGIKKIQKKWTLWRCGVDMPIIKHKPIIEHLSIYFSFIVLLYYDFHVYGCIKWRFEISLWTLKQLKKEEARTKCFKKCIRTPTLPPPQLLDPTFRSFKFPISFQQSKKIWLCQLEL